MTGNLVGWFPDMISITSDPVGGFHDMIPITGNLVGWFPDMISMTDDLVGWFPDTDIDDRRSSWLISWYDTDEQVDLGAI